MSDTLLRQWAILKNIPVFPRKITVAQLIRKLESEGFDYAEINKRSIERTIQRDLQDLSGTWPLQSDERSRPFGWSWKKDVDALTLPAISPIQALTLSLARDHLTSLLPASLMETLAPYFKYADNVLSGESVKKMADWRDKIAIVPSNQALIPPKYEEGVIEGVHAALLSEKQLEIDYAGRGEWKKTHTIHPLGLVQRGAIIYLVATMYSYEDIRILALHRIRSAKELDAPARIPEGFRLSQYIATGAFGFASGDETIRLVVRFSAAAAEHLRETPLSKDQEFIKEGDTACISATVSDSPQLRWWLLAFGDQVEVLEPASLREEFVEVSKGMHSMYGD